MNNLDSLINQLKENQIKAIYEAHSYTWTQFGYMSLLIFFINQIQRNKVDLTGIEQSAIKLEGFLIRGEAVLNYINEIKKMDEKSKGYYYAICKNLFRGTTHPIYEISNDPLVKDLISKVCFKNQDHFQTFLDILTIIRHFLSHNYSEKVILRNWDLKKDSMISKLKREMKGNISFKYIGKEFFEGYKDSDFEVDISLDLGKIEIGQSLFEAINFKQLFFLSELCNNCLQKIIDKLTESGITSQSS